MIRLPVGVGVANPSGERHDGGMTFSQGAIAMARVEMEKGADPELHNLAGDTSTRRRARSR
jgi:hypothetical protein